MTSDTEGSLSINVSEADTELYFIIASMPEFFTDVEQQYPYQIQITKGGILNIDEFTGLAIPKKLVGRYDILGRSVDKDHPGIQILRYDDGSVEKVIFVRR